MHGLKALQAAFQRSVMLGDEAFVNHIVGSENASPQLRLAIYENAYRSRLEEALAADCPILQQLLGEEGFSELSQAYIDAHPSRFFSLRWFSSALATHLGYDAEQGRHGWEADIARLELAFVDSFDAADETVATEVDAAAIPPEAWPSLRVSLHPSVQAITLHWNSLARWRTAKQEEADPGARRLDAPLRCLLWRQGLSTQYRSLPPLEASALQAVMAGADFAELCGAMAEVLVDQEQVPLQAAGFLKGWLNASMISALHY